MDRFHAAVPVSDSRIVISGGCSAIGALQDVHIFNTGEYWSFHSDCKQNQTVIVIQPGPYLFNNICIWR